jgi:uncharacterized membrane protein (UPF0127 family)
LTQVTGPRPTRLRHAGLAFLILTGCGQGHSGAQVAEVQRPLRQDAVVEVPTRGAEPIRVTVEVADDGREQAVGLMHRHLAGDGEGMLFIFPGSAIRSFWMRNTPGSLDLFFLSPDLRLVALIQRAEPMSDRILRPEATAQYVLEVPGGFAERHGVEIGAQARISPIQSPAAPR